MDVVKRIEWWLNREGPDCVPVLQVAALVGVVELREDMAAAADEIERLRAGLTTIRDTFAKDMAQGYKTKDKVFAVEIANHALADGQSVGSK